MTSRRLLLGHPATPAYKAGAKAVAAPAIQAWWHIVAIKRDVTGSGST